VIDFPQISPYIPYCVYQSAVIQKRLWREGRGEVYGEREEWFKSVLRLFTRRWKGAGTYIFSLEWYWDVADCEKERYLRALEREEPELVFLQNDTLLS
jgi:hypothetical protein